MRTIARSKIATDSRFYVRCEKAAASSIASEQKLRADLGPRDMGDGEPGCRREPFELHVLIEMAARREWIRRCRRPLHLGRRREDGHTTPLRVKHTAELTQHRDGIRKEEERDETGDGRELAVHDLRVPVGGLAR